jgi:methylmalonyl-CoA mutase C-terminal domain/subunit
VGLLAERDGSDIAVLGIGSVPEEDVAGLEEIGVAGIFTPGAPAHEIAGWVAARFGEQATT